MLIKKTKGHSDDWMTALLSSPIFQCLPPAKLKKFIMSLESVDFKKDDVILEQGREGDYYYLIKNGQCACTRKSSPNAKEIKLRQLATGDTFGEDALLSGAPRDLTITALTDISLLRLDKQQFLSLIKEPSLTFVNYAEMQGAMKQGAILIDVRTPEEYETLHLDGSINQPFFLLRMQLNTLTRGKPFIVVCRDGRISEAAAFLLLGQKFEAKILQGGMAGIELKPTNESAVPDTDNATAVDNPQNTHQQGEADQLAGASSGSLELVFFKYFEQSVDDCCRQIEIEFGFQLGADRAKMSTDNYIKLLKYLRSVQKDIKQNYLLKVRGIFDSSSQQPVNIQKKPVDIFNATLMSDDAVTENHELDKIIRKCEHLFYAELTGLNRLILGKHTIANGQNPILPGKIVRALVEVITPLDLNSDSRIALYKTFDVNVFSQLGFIYRELLLAGKLPARANCP